MHGVHHSGEEYNLTTALRQSSIHQLASWVYYLPLAFFFPPALFFIQSDFNLLYQYWIHTRAIGKLGPLEWVLNTPSQHRVHHGRNHYCIDKNYGGTLCIFDRLFGTFQEELDEVPVVFGITHALNTFEPIKANLIPWKGMVEGIMSPLTWKHKLLCFYDGPGRIPGSEPPQHYPIPPCTRNTVCKYQTDLTTSTKWYMVPVFFFPVIVMQFAGKEILSSNGSLYWYYFAGLLWSGLGLSAIGLIWLVHFEEEDSI